MLEGLDLRGHTVLEKNDLRVICAAGNDKSSAGSDCYYRVLVRRTLCKGEFNRVCLVLDTRTPNLAVQVILGYVLRYPQSALILGYVLGYP